MDLLVPLKRSKIYLWLIFMAATGGLLGVLAIGQSALATILLLVLWSSSLFWALSSWKESPTRIRISKQFVALEINGQFHALESVRVLPFLLHFPTTDGAPSALVWKDSIPDSEWRHLRMWLKIYLA